MAAAVSVLSLTACEPVPRRTLSAEEKIADMEWVFSEFGANYGPLEYKAARLGFNVEDLKNRYRDAARATANNDEFYLLLHRFVAEFKDAHTKGDLMNSELPGRGTTAYLGFTGERRGDVLYVKELLPTTTSSSAYPIQVGDSIVTLDGKDLATAVREQLVAYRDLGNDESNLTFHFNKLFTRVSTHTPLPTAENAVLTVKNSAGVVRTEVLPWIVKDLATFESEQARARGATVALQSSTAGVTRLGFLGFDGRMFFPVEAMERIRYGSRAFNFWNNFQFVDNAAGWTTDFDVDPKTGAMLARDRNFTAADRLRVARSVPEGAIMITEAATYPAYVSRETVSVSDAAGTSNNITRLVGTIWIDTFAPTTGADLVLRQFKATLAAFKTLGVRDVVIDLVNNGGGAVELGVKLAQALSAKRIALPSIQLRLNDRWMDDLQGGTLAGASDTERELLRRVFTTAQADFAAGQRLSRAYPVEFLMPFTLTPNEAVGEEGFHIALMVNEMCASMCDIFTAIMKDNGMAVVVGNKTMGAGGNVVGLNSSAPNSHFQLNQTESLIVRSSGAFVENEGIEPDVTVATSADRGFKYASVRRKAIEALLTPAPAPATVASNP